MPAARVALTSTALLCSAVLAPGAQASCGSLRDPEDPPVSIGVPTLSVALEPQRTAYRRGDRGRLTARVNLLVPDGPQSAGATVSITLAHGTRVLAKLSGNTNDNGEVGLPFNVGRYWPTGATSATATAQLRAVPSYDCRAPLVYHGGQQEVEQLFRVR